MPDTTKKYLNKEGLADYNELLPHSATQMQEYVSDWLDEHPEATTTVEDNSITTAKLRDGCVTTTKIADESVTTSKISQELYQLITGSVLRGNAIGNVISVNDAFPAFPFEVSVYGKSTQNGTPTPDAPVPIMSLNELALTFAGKNLLSLNDVGETTRNGVTYSVRDNIISVSGTPTSTFNIRLYTDAHFPLTAGEKITFSFDRTPSNITVIAMHQANGGIGTVPLTTIVTPSWQYVNVLRLNFTSGVAVNATFSVQLEQDATATEYQPYLGTNILINLTRALRSLPDGTKDTLAMTYFRPSTREGWAWYDMMRTELVGMTTTAATNGITGTVGVDVMSTTGEITDGPTVLYKLATPITTQLDQIELPVLYAPNCTIWPDPTTEVALSYERNLTIAINAIEQAIADL